MHETTDSGLGARRHEGPDAVDVDPDELGLSRGHAQVGGGQVVDRPDSGDRLPLDLRIGDVPFDHLETRRIGQLPDAVEVEVENTHGPVLDLREAGGEMAADETTGARHQHARGAGFGRMRHVAFLETTETA